MQHLQFTKLNLKGGAERSWSHPFVRLPFPSGFPDVVEYRMQDCSSAESIEAVEAMIEQGLRAYGLDIDLPNDICLVYPHKPLLDGEVLSEKREMLAQDYFPFCGVNFSNHFNSTSWIGYDQFYELLSLDRSAHEERTAVDNLLHRQKFKIREKNWRDLPGVTPSEKPRFCIIVDDTVDSGTTLAEWFSFLRQQGFYVLGAVTNLLWNVGCERLEQYPIDLFKLGHVFSNSVSNMLDPQQCLFYFGMALEQHQNSLLALTRGECEDLFQAFKEDLTFGQLLEKLDYSLDL